MSSASASPDPPNTADRATLPAANRVSKLCHPPPPATNSPAQKIVTRLARRAHRRPITDNDVETLLGYCQSGKEQRHLRDRYRGWRCAASGPAPSSSYRFRSGATRQHRPATLYRISDLELASRLSFFLWSSLPDDQLLTAAAQEPRVERSGSA